MRPSDSVVAEIYEKLTRKVRQIASFCEVPHFRTLTRRIVKQGQYWHGCSGRRSTAAIEAGLIIFAHSGLMANLQYGPGWAISGYPVSPEAFQTMVDYKSCRSDPGEPG